MKTKDMPFVSGRTDILMIDPAALQEEPGWNVRTPGPDLDAHVRWLADSIKEKGVEEALTIRMKGDVPVVKNGHCRLMAVRLAVSEGAEIKGIPCRIEDPRRVSEADSTLSMLLRNSGKPLTALETAEVIKRLLAYGWTVPDIAKKTGYSVTHVNNLLRLLASPSGIVDLVKEGSVSPTTALYVLNKEGGEQATDTLKEAVKTAKERGKARATKKDMDPAPMKINWNVWGPKFYQVCKLVSETPMKSGAWGDVIGSVNDLTEKFEESKKPALPLT